ncbi:MAG: STAS domain-containing protein [Oscillospiraceae bacterium]|nr:STAS domain-containing protein [Oscillospiraceae bacterium]
MTINKKKNGSSLVIALEGRLDTTTSPELEKVIKEETEDVNDLRFEMEKLEYISSAGLRVLLSAQKLMNKKGNMLITGCNDDIMEIFDMTGFTDILTIE